MTPADWFRLTIGLVISFGLAMFVVPLRWSMPNRLLTVCFVTAPASVLASYLIVAVFT